MYLWYSEATICYVYLEDFPCGGRPEEVLPNCRWFTRGWTLQELLAPKNSKDVRFYDAGWNYLGLKYDFVGTIAKCTGVWKDILLGGIPLADCSVAEKMSWAARRVTTRIEDTAYCLLGIFDVNMPLLYGEGTKSFRRLQEEIVKRNNDLTILAWEDEKPHDKTSIRLFADKPAAFVNGSMLEPFNDDFVDFSVTNKGLFVSGGAPLRVVSTKTKLSDKICLYALLVGTSSGRKDDRDDGGIYLRKLGPKLFIRDLTLPLLGFGLDEFKQIRHLDDVKGFWNCALHVPSNESFEIEGTVPETLWDVTDSVFLKPKPYAWAGYPMVVAIQFHVKLLREEDMNLVVLCDYRRDYENRNEETFPDCKVFWKGEYPHEEAMIFQERNRNESIYWSQLEIDAPHILRLSNTVGITKASGVNSITAYFEKGIVPSIKANVELFSLKFEIVHRPPTDQLVKEEPQSSGDEMEMVWDDTRKADAHSGADGEIERDKIRPQAITEMATEEAWISV